MKKFLFSLSIAGLILTGCTTKYTSLPESRTFINKTDFSKINSLRTGETCERRFLFFKFGNNLSAKQAAYNGGITTIKYQETSHTSFWPIYSSVCLKVYGE